MDQVGSVEVVIKGGRPWGFTLQGGIESRTALTVAQIEPNSKAERHGALKVGDHVLKINDMQCFSLADATQLIDCAFRTLTILVWRSKSITELHCDEILNTVPIANRHYQRYFREDLKNHYSSNRLVPVPSKDLCRASSSSKPLPVTQTGDSQHGFVDHSDQRTMCNPDERSTVHSSCSQRFSDRSNSTLSLSTLDSENEAVFQPLVPSSSSYIRSPRNLTKDSGYETSAQIEHDYVNMEWINNNNPVCEGGVQHSSPIAYSIPRENQSPTVPSRPQAIYAVPYKSPQKAEFEKMGHKYHNPDVAKLETLHCGDYYGPAIPLAAAHFSQKAENYANLHSSSESLSPRLSAADYFKIRPSSSSLSLVSKTIQHPQTDKRQLASSCQYLQRVVSPAHSTPNLYNNPGVVPIRPNKKQSVYEELACKSGFDFSPMLQRQKQVFEKSSQSRKSHFIQPTQTRVTSNKTSKPLACDKFTTNYCAENAYESNQVQEEQLLASAVTPPLRESSSNYRDNSAHEKFPSWPASVPVEDMNSTQGSQTGYRSNSWTEYTSHSRDVNSSYSRPKTQYQISAQQLPPVQERTKTHAKPKSHWSDIRFWNDKSDQGGFLNSRSSNANFDIIYQNTTELFHTNERHYKTHSPPERDVASIRETFNPMESRSYQESPGSHCSATLCEVYENLPFVGGMSHIDNTNTPLLDRLRLEKQMATSVWAQQNNDAFSDAGTCVSSNSSSQETLKWHGSYNDLTSTNATSNDCPSFCSDGSAIYEELAFESCDGSIKSYSTRHGSPSSNRLETSDSQQKNYRRQTPANLYAPNANSKATSLNLEQPKTSNSSYGNFRQYHELPKSVTSSSISLPSSQVLSTNSKNLQSIESGHLSKKSVVLESHELIKAMKNPSQGQNISPFRSDPPEKNALMSKELKAIQKQAVLSFYHRQTAHSKESSDKKAPRSLSFSHSCDVIPMNKPSLPRSPSVQHQIKRSVSSSSFSSRNSDFSIPTCHDETKPSYSAISSKIDRHSPLYHNVVSPNDQKLQDVYLYAQDQLCVEKEHTKQRSLENTADTEIEYPPKLEQNSAKRNSDKTVKIPTTARKAFVTSQSTNNVIVKIVPRPEITFDETESELETQDLHQAQRNIIMKTNPTDRFEVPCMSQLSITPCDYAEEEHQKLENSITIDNAMTSVTPSPELPLPPPPSVCHDEILSIDDPLPPPPPQEFSSHEMIESHIAMDSHCLSTSRNPDVFHSMRNNFSKPLKTLANHIGDSSESVDNYYNYHSSFKEASPGRSKDRLLLTENSSLGVATVTSIQNHENQKINGLENHDDEEAVYVNLEFQKQLYKSGSHNELQTPLEASSVMLTNSATQTSEATAEIPKEDNFKQNANNSHVKNKNHSSISGLLENKCNHKRHPLFYEKNQESFQSSTNLYKQAEHNATSLQTDTGLSPTNPYFTTSEPKAKLLTRYSQLWDKHYSNQLELNGQKEELIASISKKLNILRLEQIELKEETRQNEELGQEVTAKIEKIAKPNEVQKFRVHVEELEKIINLLLSLSGRLARAENALLILPKDAKPDDKIILEAKRNKLGQQHDEAWNLKENIDRRSSQVSLFLHHYFSKEEYADYEHFIKMKSKLLMDTRELDEKIKLGEEQLAALRGAFQSQHMEKLDVNSVHGAYSII